MTTEKYINYAQAREDAERLSRLVKRDVEAVPVNCDCDYSKGCYLCAGSGTYYELRFGFCQHLFVDGNQSECEREDCIHKSYLASVKRDEELETADAY